MESKIHKENKMSSPKAQLIKTTPMTFTIDTIQNKTLISMNKPVSTKNID
jgi:hypothetical protein